MPKGILDYLKTQRVCVIALEMMDGSPHVATVHFAHTEDPFTFIFETDKRYRKSEPLFGKKETRASLVVGFEEGPQNKTLQLDGVARLLAEADMKLHDAYLDKFYEKNEKLNDPNAILFSFTPTWWRFTEWGTPEGKRITTSG